MRRLAPIIEDWRLADIAADALEPGLAEFGTDIVKDGRGDPILVDDRQQHRDDPAERGADDHRIGDPEMVEQGDHVMRVGQRHVSHRLRVAAAEPAPAKISDDDMMMRRHAHREIVEVAGVAGDPVEAKQGRSLAALTIFAEMEADVVRHHVVAIAIPALPACSHDVALSRFSGLAKRVQSKIERSSLSLGPNQITLCV